MRKKSSVGQGIGRRVEAHRKLLSLSPRQYAHLVGVKSGTLSAIEEGRTTSPSTDHLVRIACFLKVSVDDLLETDAWVCIPRDLHETALQLSLSYDELCSLNIQPLREAAASKDQWKLLVRLLRHDPVLLAIVTEHPKTLATIAAQLQQGSSAPP